MSRLLAAAQAGDEHAFVELTGPHRRALHLHAYRMLGNLEDADDALQETLLRAWRGLPRFQPRAQLSTWLHRIARNVALRMLEQRRPAEPLDARLQPYPDRLVDELPTPEEQAFARVRLAREPEAPARVHDSGAEAAVVGAFLSAWADVDVPRIVALLCDDVLLTMPPMGLRFEGPVAVGEFFATQPLDGRLEEITHTSTRASGQPTLASYADGEAYGVMVLALHGDRIAGITGFPRDLELFAQLGLPLSVPAAPAVGAGPARSPGASPGPSSGPRSS